MNEENRATRAYLKRLPPKVAKAYIDSFNLPFKHSRLLHYLYVEKLNDITLAKYELEEEKIFISIFKAIRMHKEALSWISSSL